MKTCSFCAEEIQDAAIKCKHCHEFLNENQKVIAELDVISKKDDKPNESKTVDDVEHNNYLESLHCKYKEIKKVFVNYDNISTHFREDVWHALTLYFGITFGRTSSYAGWIIPDLCMDVVFNLSPNDIIQHFTLDELGRVNIISFLRLDKTNYDVELKYAKNFPNFWSFKTNYNYEYERISSETIITSSISSPFILRLNKKEENKIINNSSFEVITNSHIYMLKPNEHSYGKARFLHYFDENLSPTFIYKQNWDERKIIETECKNRFSNKYDNDKKLLETCYYDRQSYQYLAKFSYVGKKISCISTRLNDPNYSTYNNFNDNKIIFKYDRDLFIEINIVRSKNEHTKITFDYDAGKRLKSIQLLKNEINIFGRKKFIAEGKVILNNSKS